MSNNQDVAVVPSAWARSLGIPENTIQEVKLFSQLGWAMDNYGKSRQLNINEQKMMALATYKNGFSAMGKQLIFLGNGLYVTKGGKISKARKDDKLPLARVKVRPATGEEKDLFGIEHQDATKPLLYEHLWFAEIYARVDGKIELVSEAYGHACVNNIKLHGKTNDPTRLCADMASTRAQSRALSQVYDFFGLDSWEEVGLMSEGEPNVIDVSAEVVEPEKSNNTNKKTTKTKKSEGGCTVKEVIAFMEENKQYIPQEIFQKYSASRMESYTQEGLSKTYEIIKKKVEEAKQNQSDVPKAGQEEGKDAKTPA